VALACACKTSAVASALWMMDVASAAALSLGLRPGADPPAGAAGAQPTSQADTQANIRSEINP